MRKSIKVMVAATVLVGAGALTGCEGDSDVVPSKVHPGCYSVEYDDGQAWAYVGDVCPTPTVTP